MRLIRFGEADHEKPGVLGTDGMARDVSAFGEDWNEDFFARFLTHQRFKIQIAVLL